MKNYVGRKCKGFRFQDGTDGIAWDSYMENYIGKIGVIYFVENNSCAIIDFKNDTYGYPISLIEEHLIPESPEIPQLGEGIEMEVSNALIPWQKRKIIAKRHDGLFIDDNGILWPHARPIPEVKKYTKEELVKILGHDFEIV
jgi:hypothetical protein